MAIQKFIANKLLGQDTVAASTHAVSAVGPDTGSGSLFSWLGDDSRMIDAARVNQQFHATPPILQESEHVEMAFKGRRDLTLFTTKRLLFVDLKGWSGHKVNYVSVPWTTVLSRGRLTMTKSSPSGNAAQSGSSHVLGHRCLADFLASQGRDAVKNAGPPAAGKTSGFLVTI